MVRSKHNCMPCIKLFVVMDVIKTESEFDPLAAQSSEDADTKWLSPSDDEGNLLKPCVPLTTVESVDPECPSSCKVEVEQNTFPVKCEFEEETYDVITVKEEDTAEVNIEVCDILTERKMNQVKYLKSKALTNEDRVLAKKLGPPRPELCINQVFKDRTRTYNRNFNKTVYEKWNWMCGCPLDNAVFCFPCILFGGENMWTKTGVKDLKHLLDKSKKHGMTRRHLDNEMSFAVLGKTDIRKQLNDGYRASVRKHNELVDKNRYILSRIIDAVKFCGEFELALRGHDETEGSDNPGILRGLINYTAALDNALKDHLENSSVFKGTSSTIQNELLDAILSICQEHILSEISEVDFLSIQADQTTDNSCKTLLSLVFRYQIEGKITEKFWGYFEVSDRSAAEIATIILNQLREIGVEKSPEKLICQTYDGASVMSGQNGGVQHLIKEKYCNANYVHCYAHQGNHILQSATSSCTKSRIFFQDLQGIGTFFSRSPKRMDYLIEFVQEKLGSVPPTRWHFQHRTVNTVFDNKENLIKFFQHIRDTERSDTKASTEATGFVRTLTDPQFVYWLNFFHKIMPHVAVFFDSIRKKDIDSVKVSAYVKSLANAIEHVRKLYENEEESLSEPLRKRQCVEYGSSRNNRLAVSEVCDMITNHINDRFKFSDHLCTSRLFFVDKFSQYCNTFPESDFYTTLKLYPKLNGAKLRMELEVLYSREDLRSASGAAPLLQFFYDNNMWKTFSECMLVLKIIVTIPMITMETERTFSTLNRIKTFIRNSKWNERLNALAMLSIEKKMIHSIPDFNKRVIEKFASAKSRRIELIYKK
ncbi:zinc finger MYM-type protein 1-like isoform X1 [Periplaneta americana]|uniref:zinc finger MYM-type protein 1-like isoform X1 n=3 Tax=Periplaneta americana TaxID=6978 RepID=UPI0037E9B0F0